MFGRAALLEYGAAALASRRLAASVDETSSALLSADSSQTLGYSTSYVPNADFATMDTYPIGHLHGASGTNYVYADPATYQGYYTQYQPSAVHSPTHSYPLHSTQHAAGSPGSVDDSDGQLGHAARASPQTLKWLYDNYEVAEGTSLPRCTLYDHYKKHCSDTGLEPVNAASFGKLIRSVFSGLKTRRLGTRGNSKYHYYGIRIKPQSSLNHFSEDYAMHKKANSYGSEASTTSYQTYDNPANSAPPMSDGMDDQGYSMGEGHVPRLFPDFGSMGTALEQVKLEPSHVMKLIEGYRHNCQDVLNNARELHFELIEDTWLGFWSNDALRVERYPVMKTLTGEQLRSLYSIAQIKDWVVQTDYYFYQVLIDVLVPNVLCASMKLVATQVRQSAKHLEGYMSKALSLAPIEDDLVKRKMEAVRMLIATLRRYTSLNHLAMAARGVLAKPEQMTQMVLDFVKVEFTPIQEQAGWVCTCESNEMVTHFTNSFRENLEKQISLEAWAQWLEQVLDNILARFHDKPVSELTEVAKQFLLTWSFYSDLIIRDLTLRSAHSFGSFHLIRLLFDDFMHYLVEQRIAKASDRPTITVTVKGFRDSLILFEQTAQENIITHSRSDEWEIVGSSEMDDADDLMYGESMKPIHYVVPGEQNIERHALVQQNSAKLCKMELQEKDLVD